MIPIPPSVLLAAGVFAAGFGLGGFLVHDWYSPRLELSEHRVDALKDALDTQNTAVADLKAKGEANAKRAAKALAAAEQARIEAERAALDIIALPAPEGADRCVSASALIRKELAK